MTHGIAIRAASTTRAAAQSHHVRPLRVGDVAIGAGRVSSWVGVDWATAVAADVGLGEVSFSSALASAIEGRSLGSFVNNAVMAGASDPARVIARGSSVMTAVSVGTAA